jgi:methyl-accepting chemotaxis protein
MLQWLTNLPIFRRLFLAFILAALIPDILIIIVSSHYIQVFDAACGGICKLSSDQAGSLVLTPIIALLVTTVTVVIVGFLMNITITRRLRYLATFTTRISKGETNERASVTGRDEIYVVAASMNTMLDRIVRLLQETQGQHYDLRAQVEKLVKEVSSVGEGDLRVQAQVTTDTLGILAESLNTMIAALSSLIIRLKKYTQGVEISATNMHDQMTQLVEDAEMRLQHMATATREVAQMTLASQKVAERVQVLDDAAKDTHLSAQTGRATVQQTTEGIERINENVQTTADKVQRLGEHSRQINDIASVIADIAHQTNRLALDAAVQAAVAGENGKGFRIVAVDIRRLAEQTKEQTTMINRIIQGIREDIGAVAMSMNNTQRETATEIDLVQGTGESLEEIFVLVEQQAAEIEMINTMIRALLQSSGRVTHIMQEVSQSTRQSSSSTRVVAQNMEHLAGLAKQLLTSMEAFKIKRDATLSSGIR